MRTPKGQFFDPVAQGRALGDKRAMDAVAGTTAETRVDPP